MTRFVQWSLIALVSVGCATGGAAGPTFEYQPANGPLRYSVASTDLVLVDTPMGLQESGDSVRATIAIAVGGGNEHGRELTATYEALTVRVIGGVSRSGDVEELLNRPLRGTLSPSGAIEITGEVPSTSLPFDARASLVDFLVPMPPDGNTAEPWPVSITVSTEDELTVTAVFEGTGRIMGDTVWNGRSAKVIRVDGDVTLSGGGQPAESPVPIEVSWTGSSTRIYVWDHMAGVMLASTATDDLSGPISLVGMDMSVEATAEGQRTIELVP